MFVIFFKWNVLQNRVVLFWLVRFVRFFNINIKNKNSSVCTFKLSKCTGKMICFVLLLMELEKQYWKRKTGRMICFVLLLMMEEKYCWRKTGMFFYFFILFLLFSYFFNFILGRKKLKEENHVLLEKQRKH